MSLPPSRERSPGCFLIGSGPSLNAVDGTCLSGVHTIAFNRSYVAWPAWGFIPTFYACLSLTAVEDNAEDLRHLVAEHRGTKFYLPVGSEAFGLDASAQVLHVRLVDGQVFSRDLLALTDFGNVGATSLQILAILGYRRIAMIGVDARYTSKDNPPAIDGEGYLRTREDPDYFIGTYARYKRPWSRPDLAKILGQWPDVARECERAGLSVRNSSPGSALDCFPSTNFDDALAWIGKADRMIE